MADHAKPQLQRLEERGNAGLLLRWLRRQPRVLPRGRDPALSCTNLDGKLSAPLGRHHSFDVLDDTRQQTAVIVELLGTVDDAVFLQMNL